MTITDIKPISLDANASKCPFCVTFPLRETSACRLSTPTENNQYAANFLRRKAIQHQEPRLCLPTSKAITAQLQHRVCSLNPAVEIISHKDYCRKEKQQQSHTIKADATYKLQS